MTPNEKQLHAILTEIADETILERDGITGETVLAVTGYAIGSIPLRVFGRRNAPQ